MEPFPSNSQTAKPADRPPKRVEQVTSASAVRRRKPLGKQFKQTFLGGDARTAAQYMLYNVLIPSAKEAIVEAFATGFEKLVYGDSRRPRRGAAPTSGPLGYVSYNRMNPAAASQAATPMGMSRRSRARQSFSDIVISTRQEAEEVLDRMYDLLSKYESVSVADLYELTGIESGHTDHKWGWTNLRGAGVGRVRSGGYLLELPDPEPL